METEGGGGDGDWCAGAERGGVDAGVAGESAEGADVHDGVSDYLMCGKIAIKYPSI